MHFLLAAESSGGLGALGLNLSGLIFQLINFGILYWVLAKYAFPALTNLLENRRKQIEAGLKDAEEAHRAKLQAEAERHKVIEQAKAEASELVSAARTEAKKSAEKIIVDASAAANASVEQATARIERERRAAKDELVGELGGIVARATASVTREELTPKADDAVVKRALQEAGR